MIYKNYINPAAPATPCKPSCVDYHGGCSVCKPLLKASQRITWVDCSICDRRALRCYVEDLCERCYHKESTRKYQNHIAEQARLAVQPVGIPTDTPKSFSVPISFNPERSMWSKLIRNIIKIIK